MILMLYVCVVPLASSYNSMKNATSLKKMRLVSKKMRLMHTSTEGRFCMETYLESFLHYIEAVHTGSINTTRAYRADILEYLSFIKINKINHLDNITYKQIDFFLYTIKTKEGNTIDISTISRKISSLTSYYRYLNEFTNIKMNPFLLYSVDKKKAAPEFLNIKEVNKLFRHIDVTTTLGRRNYTIIEVLYSCGLSVSECCNLKCSDINYDKSIIKITENKKEIRIIPIPSSEKKHFKEYEQNTRIFLLKEEEQDYFFLNEKGRKLSDRGIRYIIDDIGKKAKFKKKINPQMLRNSFAKEKLKQGVSFELLQYLLGHTNVATTKRYKKEEI